MNKVLVTGGAGFVGHHFVNYILEKTNAEVVVLDNLYNGDFSRINQSDRVTLLNCSVLDIEEYSKYIDKERRIECQRTIETKYNDELIKNGYYSESHLCRPYTNHVDYIDRMLSLIPKYN